MHAQNSRLEQSTGGLHCAAVSDVGMRRTNNQDAMAVTLAEDKKHWQSHGHLFLVADGMGAHAAGELASKLATDTIPHAYFKGVATESPSESIAAAVREANRVIFSKGQNTVDFLGMGTTCSCLLLLPSGALVAHVGDSRVYRLRGNELQQLTFDHSLVWEMAAAGHATEEEVPAYVPKNVITRSLGPHPTVAVDLEGPFSVRSGDRYLLCSDGLTGPLKPQLIGLVLSTHTSAEAAQTLVDLANLLGGPDNITVVLAEVVESKDLGGSDLPQVAPTAPKSARPKTSFAPWLWASLAAAALIVLFVILRMNEWAVGVAVVWVVMTAIAWLVQASNSEEAHQTQSHGVRGKAPYRDHVCAPNAESIEPLIDIIRQLEDLEDQREWDFVWQPIHEQCWKGHQAVGKANYQEATVAYCEAVRLLMKSLRETQAEKPSDSTLDLG